MKKYELTTETKKVRGKTLHRIRALVSFGDVCAGEMGGWIEKEDNLSQNGAAWVYGEARVSDKACICGAARVCGAAEVSGEATVSDNACVYGESKVSGVAMVYENAEVYGEAEISGAAEVCGRAQVCGQAEVSGNAEVYGEARVSGNARVEKNAHLFQLGAIGSRDDFTTFFRTKDEQVFVSCGCFHGSIADFAEKVKRTHGDSKHAKTYALAIEIAKLQIEDTIEIR